MGTNGRDDEDTVRELPYGLSEEPDAPVQGEPDAGDESEPDAGEESEPDARRTAEHDARDDAARGMGHAAEGKRDEGDDVEAVHVAAGAPKAETLLAHLEAGYALARECLDGELASLGLTRTDVLFLETLQARHDAGFDPAMTDFAEVFERDRSRVSQIAHRLEAAGVIEKRVNRRNRRVRNLVLTDEGTRRLEHARRCIAGVAGELFADLTPDDRKTVARSLVSMHEAR